MRRLIVMRHAKSSWDDPALTDRERPLNPRGRRSAPQAGAWLARNDYRPGHALISDARRTRETWDAVRAEAGDCPAEFFADLYAAGPDALLRRLRAAPDVDCLLMLGHMPGIGEFARRLLAAPPDDPRFEKFPTAATAVIDLPGPGWRDSGWGEGRLVDFVVPRELG